MISRLEIICHAHLSIMERSLHLKDGVMYGMIVIKTELETDIFPNDPTQWSDQDNDGYGDNAGGTTPDGCPSVTGNSTTDLFGCLDRDGDGYSDTGDSFPLEFLSGQIKMAMAMVTIKVVDLEIIAR